MAIKCPFYRNGQCTSWPDEHQRVAPPVSCNEHRLAVWLPADEDSRSVKNEKSELHSCGEALRVLDLKITNDKLEDVFSLLTCKSGATRVFVKYVMDQHQKEQDDKRSDT